MAHSYRSLSRFLWHEAAIEVFLLPLDRMLVHRRSLPRNLLGSPTIRQYSFIHLGGERQFESKVSCPRTQQNVPGQGSSPRLLALEWSTLTMGPPHLPLPPMMYTIFSSYLMIYKILSTV